MYSRDNDGLVNTDDTNESLQTDTRAPIRLRLQHRHNLSKSLKNSNGRNTITPLRITDKGRSEIKLEKQKKCISVARREKHMIKKKINFTK